MIGNHKSNSCECCGCCYKQAPYRLYNVGGATAVRIVSWEDENSIWRNVESDPLGQLDSNAVLETSSSLGDIFYSCAPIFSSGERGASSRSLIPEYMASNRLGFTTSRYGGVEINIYSLDASSADIYRNGTLVTTIPLTPNSLDTFTQTGNYTGVWEVVADGQILGAKGEDTPFNGDASVMTKPYADLLGWASTAAYISKENASLTPTAFDVYSHLGNFSSVVTTTFNVVNSADLPHSNAQDNYYDPNVNVRVQSAENLYGNGRADSDGGDDTPLMPVDLLTTHHKIPQPSEFVSLSNLNGGTIDVFDAIGALITTLTPTKVNTDPLAPYAVRFGTPNGGSNVPAGYSFVSNDPLVVVYQPKGAGSFGSDDDETISFGYNL